MQTLPAGFLGLLGIKSNGENPSPLQPGVSSVIDLFRFYAANSTPRGQDLIAVGASGGQGLSTFNVVPQNKCWLVTSITTRAMVPGATAFINPYLAAVDNQLFFRKCFTMAGLYAPAAGQNGQIVMSGDPFFMLPGWKMAAGAGGPAGATAYSHSYDMDVFEFQL